MTSPYTGIMPMRSELMRESRRSVVTTRKEAVVPSAEARNPEMDHGSRRAFRILRLAFIVAPIVAGLDKFFNFLTDWDKYLAPVVSDTLGVQPQTFMMIVGAVEIAAGIVVALYPRIGGYIVAAWLLAIIGNLVVVGGYLDVALRDLGLLWPLLRSPSWRRRTRSLSHPCELAKCAAICSPSAFAERSRS